MTTPKETLWDLEPHTKAKHEILKRYLAAWFPILNKYHDRIVYIDGFSGPGRYKGGEKGSPVIAIEVALNHRKTMEGKLVFCFLDEREDRVEHLRSELEELDIPSHFKVICESGKFHEEFGEILDSIDARKKSLAPTFAFIDPFGFSGIPFTLIKQLLEQKRCEAFITFMVDSINRFLAHPEDKIASHIAETFGTDHVFEIANGGGDRLSAIRALYQAQLQGAAKYVRYFEMRDGNNRTQYYLFFATNHELGHLKMKEAMWRVDPDGEFRFSDATDPDQMVLFESDTSSVLKTQLRKRFRGCGVVSGLDVRKFIENNTAFLKKHMTEVLKQEESDNRIKVEPKKSDETLRKKGTYPDGARITFV